MIVYLVTNLVDGKQYVGQTIKPLEKRWKQHLRDVKRKSLPHLYNAIEKYGYNNFKVEEIHRSVTREELDFAEIFYIRFLNTLSPAGYNLSNGGTTGSAHTGHKHSEETKLILKKKSSGILNANFGKPKSDAVKRKISESNKITRPWNHGSTGYQKYKCRCDVCVAWHRKHYSLKENLLEC